MENDDLPEFSPEDDVIPDFEGDQLRINRLKVSFQKWLTKIDILL